MSSEVFRVRYSTWCRELVNTSLGRKLGWINFHLLFSPSGMRQSGSSSRYKNINFQRPLITAFNEPRNAKRDNFAV